MWRKTRKKEALPMSESHSFLSGEILHLLKKNRLLLKGAMRTFLKRKFGNCKYDAEVSNSMERLRKEEGRAQSHSFVLKKGSSS